MLQNNIDFNIEIFGDTKVTKINACKEFLNQTDYAVIKMYETVIQGGSIEDMQKEYEEVLNNRADARALINELEKGMENGE